MIEDRVKENMPFCIKFVLIMAALNVFLCLIGTLDKLENEDTQLQGLFEMFFYIYATYNVFVARNYYNENYLYQDVCLKIGVVFMLIFLIGAIILS